jgi:phage-related protein (TIGR01555 family)
MGVVRYFSDKLVNLVANLGTERDKSSGSTYAPAIMSDEELINAYRGAWLPRKIVDIPAMDSCRKWRNWQADKDEIEKIEAEEKRLGIKSKVLDAMIKARLFGGAAVFIGTGERDLSQPLNPDRVRAGGIKYLTVMTRRNLHPTEIEQDPESPRYGKPKAFTLAGNSVTIHPSRLVEFVGARHPDADLAMGQDQGWGDSVLLAVMDAIKHADATMANIASLIFEAKVDVISIPDFMQNMQDKEYEKRILERLRLAALAKGINGTLILDKEEEYSSKSANFSTLPDILDRFLQVVSGAADIPATRLLSQAPAGLSATGESDLRNYYDRVQAMQELDTGPAMYIFDECLIRSALGSRPAEIHYAWAPLWQSTAKERSDIGKTTADTIKVLKDCALFPDEALSQAAVTLLVENGVVPGLEAAIDQFGSELPEDEETELEESTAQPTSTKITDAAPRSLYVSRDVLNAGEIIAWAKAQGFETALPANDMHVTVAYSRKPLDWMKVGESWSSDRDGKLSVAPGGARLIEKFGEGAIVLLFNSSELAWRHVSIIEAGASWDWPEYQPHITFTYDPGSVDLSKVEPYRGAIELGPEIFAEVVENWQDKLKEQ